MTTITIHIDTTTTHLPASGQQQQQGTEGASAAPVGPAPAPEPPPAFVAPWRADRNGWIHSRLPGPGDANSSGQVRVPYRCGSEACGYMNYNIVVPGQPWAPIHSSGANIGPYEP